MPREEDRNQLLRYTTALADTLPAEFITRFQERLGKARSWQPLKAPDANEWNTYSGSVTRNRATLSRFDPDGWPTWNQQLERYSGSSDRVAASKPRVSESENGLLSYHPVVHRGRVYVNELNRITAYDLENGSAWPSTKPPLPLFDSHIAPAALLPLGYPLVGAPRGTLTVHDDCLYARMGSPVTGWANGEKAGDGGSIGYIIGLDLQRQGSLMRGFPLHLSQFDFGGSEPEGCPLVSVIN